MWWGREGNSSFSAQGLVSEKSGDGGGGMGSSMVGEVACCVCVREELV